MKLPKIVFFLFPLIFLFAKSIFASTEPITVYLSEFVANPQENSEWVEIYNPTATSVDLTGWQIDDIEDGSSPFLIPTGTTISSLEFLVFEIGTKLNNSGDSVKLLDDSGNIVDQFDYPSATKGMSWARDQNYDWQETIEQTPGEANVIVIPTPTPTPTTTPTPTLSPTPTPTPTSTPTPTPQSKPAISFSPPAEVQVNKEFSLSVNLSNANANSSYYLKALIGETNNPSEMYEGKTKSEDGQSFLAWNASWNKMPVLQTNASGNGERTIEVKVNDDVTAGSYFLVIRIRKTDTTTNFDSEAKSLKVTALESEEPATTENTEEFAEDTEKIPSTLSSPSSPIFIAEAREGENGKTVTVEGVVTAEPELLGSRAMFIEDESGGIKVLLDEKNRNDIKLGDLVRITGELGEAFNERYIKVFTTPGVEILGQGEIPEAPLVETGAIDEEYEGELILVNGQVAETSGAVFYLDDGSGQVKVYLKSSTKIEKPKMKKGYYSEVRGICSQYSDDYRLLPRYQDDILVSQNPIEKGSVLGTVASLPETGFHINDFGLLSLGIGLILRRLLE